MMGVLSLGVGANNQITLSVNGADEKEALQAVSALLSSNIAQEKKR